MEEDDKTTLRSRTGESVEPEIGNPRDQPAQIASVVIESKLGEGGMAVVYAGQDQGFSPPRRVAVKLMGSDLSQDPDFRARFEQEASIVADFRHDNIVHVYASGEVDNEKYLIMEYLPGGTLADRMEGPPLPAVEAMDIALAMADALAYSHARGIVHRDFKPGNIMFTGDGKPVLSDFGVAKVTNRKEADLTRHASLIGAPRYMAPEQELGETVTGKADVYSWALTVFEMLDGNPVPAVLRQSHGPEHESKLAARLLGVPKNIVSLLSRCMAADPDHRPSATECVEALRTLRREQRGEDARSRSHSRRKPKRKALAAGLSLMALSIAGGAAYYLLRPQPDAPEPQTVRKTAEDGSPEATPMLNLPVDRSPPGALVYINDRLVPGFSVELEPGQHELLAIANGYAGTVETLLVDPNRDAPVIVRLEPLQVPTLEEIDAFIQILGRPTIQDSDFSVLKTSALAQAVKAKQLAEAGNTQALSKLMNGLQKLLDHGDLRSAATLSLAAGAVQDSAREQALLPEVHAAADAGDPLATLLVIQAIKDESGGRVLDATSPEFRTYCERVRQLDVQGWGDMAARLLAINPCDI